MCRPGHGSSRDPSAGGYIGPPLHGGVFGNQRKFAQETDLAPTGRDRARPLQGDREWTGGGVRSPRPTGATLVVPSNGPRYLGHGLRRPNSVPKFGALVIGIGPYGDGGSTPGRRALRGRRAVVSGETVKLSRSIAVQNPPKRRNLCKKPESFAGLFLPGGVQ